MDVSRCVGIEPVVIQDGSVRVLVDAGLGWGLDHGSDFQEVSNVASNLDIFGWKPEDIDFVLLSHLHYDHCAGCSYVNEKHQTTATFPNATIIVRRAEWEAAQQIIARQEWSEYQLDEFYKLIAEGRVHFLDEAPFTLLPGIQLIHTGGHTPGHQIVRIEDGGASAVFPGDLIPTEQDLNGGNLNSGHVSEQEAKKARIHLLRYAHANQSELFFYHARFTNRGKVTQDNQFHYQLLPSRNNELGDV